MAMKTKKKTLADKISSLITAAPVQFGSDDECDITSAKVVDNFEESDTSDNDFRQSKFRKQNIDLLDQVDQRYKGKKVSRKDLDSEEENNSIEGNTGSEQSEAESWIQSAESEEIDLSNDEIASEEDSDQDSSIQRSVSEEDDDDEDNINEEGVDKAEDEEEEEDEDEDEDEDDNDNDEEYDIDIGNPLRRNREITDNFKTMSDTNVRAEIEKGNCVRGQLKVWEHLLEMRIQLQKCLVTSNQMPQYDVYKNFKVEPDFMSKTNDIKNKLSDILDKMLKLQTVLLKQYPETKNISLEEKNIKAGKRKAEEIEEDSMDEEISSDTDNENEKDSHVEEEDEEENKEKATDKKIARKKRKLSELEKELSERHKCYTDYRDSVIQKWNDKTRITTGAINKDTQQTALKQIEFALHDKDKLRKRAQLKRSEYVILGKPLTEEGDDDGRRIQEYDPEIYDDDDFYHQLLRDLIEHKCTGVTDPVQLSKQWIQLQNIRSKMKRKIDTRATKGRRVRYNVHNKLVNFMAPITVNDTWTDVAKNELYNSLFGKMKSLEQ